MNNVPRRLRSEEVRFLLIDIQEKLFPHIYNREEIRANTARLLAAARLLDAPMFYTEQYPAGIGLTDENIRKAIPDGSKRFEKMHFSCFDEPEFKSSFMASDDAKVTVVWGIETHICIMTTVMDMLDCGLQVAVVSDAVGSRLKTNSDMALDAMRSAGALVIPTESVVYQMLGVSGTDKFKAMLPYFK
jgi:nicotinamidase-related amidase